MMNKIIDGLMDEGNRFGNAIILLIITAILGGVAVMFFMDNAIALACIVIPTMLAESLILAIQPLKRIVYTSLLACLVSIGYIISGLII